jgi:hypothetical protein
MPAAVPVLSSIGGALTAGALTGTAAAVAGGVAVAGATVGVASTVKSAKAAQRGAQAQAQAAQTQVRIQQQQVAQQRRQSIRRSIIARSQLRQRAQAAGLDGSSAVAGGIGSVSSQLGTNLGFGSMMSGLSGAYTSLTGQANYLSSQSQMFGQISQIGFGMARGIAGIQGPLQGGMADFFIGPEQGPMPQY